MTSIAVFWTGILLSWVGFPAQREPAAGAADSQAKRSITFDQLDRDITVLGIVGAPVGQEVRITGYLTHIDVKPGTYLQVESVNGKPASHLVPEWFVEGKLPSSKLGERFSFSARSTLEYRIHSADAKVFDGYYSTLLVTPDPSEQPSRAEGEVRPRGPSPFGPSPVPPKAPVQTKPVPPRRATGAGSPSRCR